MPAPFIRRWLPLLLLLPLTGVPLPPRAAAQPTSSYDSARQRMVDESVVGTGVKDPRVVRAMRATPRHEFVDAAYRSQAYFDMALPIGSNQTISSPFIVAYMTQSLDPQPTDRVLEIGTGSGYQAAVLSPLVAEVRTIEIVEALGLKAAQTLKRLNYANVFVKVGDGFQGWPEHAPFDKIIVTCSPEKPPQPLIDQLREGGLMVIPVGERYQQTLYLMRKKNGELIAEALQPTLFVPMTGAAEEARQIQPDPTEP
ncbi:MAG: protein-L-isoaspartate(D-aspartate) O-methyltransferase, partial [Pirellulaceae bacterium]